MNRASKSINTKVDDNTSEQHVTKTNNYKHMKHEYDVAVIGGGAAGLTSAGMAVNNPRCCTVPILELFYGKALSRKLSLSL